MKKIVSIALIGMVVFLPLEGHAASKSVSVNVSVTIPPLFEIEVGGPAGGNIEFGVVNKDPNGAVTADSPEVVITTRTNLQQAYQVTQKLVTPLSNGQGDTIAPEDFTVQSVSSIEGGSASNGGGVSTQDSSFFTSNGAGKSNTLRAIYRLKVKPEQAAGTYQSKLVYTIVTL